MSISSWPAAMRILAGFKALKLQGLWTAVKKGFGLGTLRKGLVMANLDEIKQADTLTVLRSHQSRRKFTSMAMV